MDLEDAGTRVKFVLHDRDASFTAAFDSVLQAAGARIICSAVQAPGCRPGLPTTQNSCSAAIPTRSPADRAVTQAPGRMYIVEASPLMPNISSTVTSTADASRVRSAATLRTGPARWARRHFSEEAKVAIFDDGQRRWPPAG
jgi:hypothetical protein